MNGLLRSLHPQIEAAHLAVVWHGASFRNYDFTPAPLVEDHARLTVEARQRGRPSEDQMRRWLTDVPATAVQAASDLKISYDAAKNLLFRLVQRGQCVRTFGTAVDRLGRERSVVRYAKQSL